MLASQMISTHPHVQGNLNQPLAESVEACMECASTCVICADACLGEPMVSQLTQCIRLNSDCADVCAATAAVASRRTGSNEAVIKLMLRACMEACRECGTECRRHAGDHDHCRICAEACERCERACQQALQTFH